MKIKVNRKCKDCNYSVPKNCGIKGIKLNCKLEIQIMNKDGTLEKDLPMDWQFDDCPYFSRRAYETKHKRKNTTA